MINQTYTDNPILLHMIGIEDIGTGQEGSWPSWWKDRAGLLKTVAFKSHLEE